MSLIPKVIHQIWYQGEANIPVKYQSNQQLWKQMHPNPKWKHILWSQSTMEKLIKSKYSHLWSSYSTFKYMHQKIDFFKYIILFDQGGIYIDIDAKPIKPLDDLLDQKFPSETMFLCHCKSDWLESKITTGYDKFVNNGVMLSVKEHPFLKKVIDYVNNVSFNSNLMPRELYINKTTGPIMITKMYYDDASSNSVKLLNYTYFEPCYPFEKRCQYTENTYIDHQHELTWVSKPIQILLQIYLALKRYKCLVLMFMILLMYYYFFR